MKCSFPYMSIWKIQLFEWSGARDITKLCPGLDLALSRGRSSTVRTHVRKYSCYTTATTGGTVPDEPVKEIRTGTGYRLLLLLRLRHVELLDHQPSVGFKSDCDSCGIK